MYDSDKDDMILINYNFYESLLKASRELASLKGEPVCQTGSPACQDEQEDEEVRQCWIEFAKSCSLENFGDYVIPSAFIDGRKPTYYYFDCYAVWMLSDTTVVLDTENGTALVLDHNMLDWLDWDSPSKIIQQLKEFTPINEDYQSPFVQFQLYWKGVGQTFEAHDTPWIRN